MENGNQNNRILEKKIIYIKQSDNYLMIYCLSDVIQSEHTVVMANFVYRDTDLNFNNLEKLFNELVMDELDSPFMNWYPTIEKAIQSHLEDFS